MKKTFIIFLILWLSQTSGLCRETGLPPIERFPATASAMQGNNFVAGQDDDNIIYIGTKKGLVRFDGYNSDLFTTTAGSPVISLLPNEGRIYVGSYGDFGYFEPDEYGRLHFRSLLPEDLNDRPANDAYHSVIKSEREIFFVGKRKVWRFKPDVEKLTEVSADIADPNAHEKVMRASAAFSINGEIYVQNSGGDFYKLKGESWALYWPRHLFGDDIIAIAPSGNFRRSTARIPEDARLVTRSGRTMTVADGLPRRIGHEETNISGEEVAAATILRDNSYLMAIPGKGLIRISADGIPSEPFLLRDNAANEVTSLFTDNDGNVWATQLTGGALLHYGSGIQIMKNPEFSEYFEEKDAENRLIADKIKRLLPSVGRFEVERPGEIWGEDLKNGVTRAGISQDEDRLSFNRYFPTLGEGEPQRKTHVIKVKGKIYFSNADGFYSYDESDERFKRVEKMNEDLQGLGEFFLTAESDNSHFWAVTDRGVTLVNFDENNYHPLTAIPGEFFTVWPCEEELSILVTDSATYMKNGGEILVAQQKFKEKTPNFPKLSFSFIRYPGKKDEPVYLPLNDKKKKEVKGSEMQVGLSFPDYERMPCVYRFKLRGGGENRDSLSRVPAISYHHLKSGSYTLDCSVIALNGEVIDGIACKFSINRPWGLRWWAWLSYILILIGAVFILSKVFSKQDIFRRHRHFEEETTKRDRTIREQARIIARQEKRIMESGLSPRSKELMEMPLGAEARQLVLDNIRETLADRKKARKGVAEAEKVFKEISLSESDNRIFWDSFDKNFNLIHEHYFRELKEHYPALTDADMKFCALLRMDLTTKEIATFTSLSTRGVETARYRLRKRLGIGGEQSIGNFLKEWNSVKVGEETSEGQVNG